MKNSFIDPFDTILSEAITNPEKRYYFYKAFLDLEIVAIGTVSSDKKSSEPILHLKHIEMNKELVLPVYSSVEKFNSIYKGKYKYIKISTRMLLQLIELDSTWVLNPGFDISKKIIPEELETLRDGRILHYFFEELGLEEKQSFLTNQMTEIPQSVLEDISSRLKNFPTIKNAYFTHIYNPAKSTNPIPLIGITVEQEEENSEELLLNVFKAVNDNTQQRIQILNLIVNLPLTNSIINGTEPFYNRTTIDDLKSMFR
ncbi:enhanced serine sensitivity protein SseB C-terminal domain-containing protein [Bacillus sp. JJ1521]|uniref:enhanced serine sensitivity protein SseB C-terminal domain-containing protein n=1 Tax=Bacillus sp. JJ1521 TaxID=3122957 RepID=UPI002FFD9DE4